MKNFKISVCALVLMFSAFAVTPVFSQSTSDNSGMTAADLFTADFTATVKGYKASDIYYFQKVNQLDGIVGLKIILKPTAWGKIYFAEQGLPTSTVKFTYYTFFVDITTDKYMLETARYIYDDDSMSETISYPLTKESWITPELGTVGDCYIKLARKLSYLPINQK